MTYTEFEMRFLLALVDATSASRGGQCAAFPVAETILPQVNEQWVRNAVQEFEQQEYLGPAISRTLDGQITLTISAKARKLTESIKAQIVANQQSKAKIVY